MHLFPAWKCISLLSQPKMITVSDRFKNSKTVNEVLKLIIFFIDNRWSQKPLLNLPETENYIIVLEMLFNYNGFRQLKSSKSIKRFPLIKKYINWHFQSSKTVISKSIFNIKKLWENTNNLVINLSIFVYKW